MCSPSYPGTHCVDQGGLKLRDPLTSISQVLGLNTCNTMLGTPLFLDGQLAFLSSSSRVFCKKLMRAARTHTQNPKTRMLWWHNFRKPNSKSLRENWDVKQRETPFLRDWPPIFMCVLLASKWEALPSTSSLYSQVPQRRDGAVNRPDPFLIL